VDVLVVRLDLKVSASISARTASRPLSSSVKSSSLMIPLRASIRA
jgi:hypothetical protein